jgi:hypothetical protein
MFLGLVHAGRIELGHADTTVYGILTDCVTFKFYRINWQEKWDWEVWKFGPTQKR